METDASPRRVSPIGRAHLTSSHGPASVQSANAALYRETPAWILDMDGAVVAANSFVLFVWDLTWREARKMSVFEIFEKNASRLTHPQNDQFWRSKFRVEALVDPEGLPPLRRLRAGSEHLQNIYSTMRDVDEDDVLWQYIVRLKDPTASGRELEFRTTVSLILDANGNELGFLAEYQPQPGAQWTVERLQKLSRESSEAGISTVFGQPLVSAESADPLERAEFVESSREGVEASRDLRSDQYPASLSGMAALSVAAVLAIAAPVLLLLLQGSSLTDGVTPLIFIPIVGGSLATVVALARAFVNRSEYLSRARSLIMELRGARTSGIARISLFDEDVRRWLDQLLADARVYRDGLMLAGYVKAADEINIEIYELTAELAQIESERHAREFRSMQ